MAKTTTTETHGVRTEKNMEKFFVKKKCIPERDGRNSHIPTTTTTISTIAPFTSYELSVQQLHIPTGRHGDAVIPLSPPYGAALILPAVVLLGH